MKSGEETSSKRNICPVFLFFNYSNSALEIIAILTNFQNKCSWRLLESPVRQTPQTPNISHFHSLKSNIKYERIWFKFRVDIVQVLVYYQLNFQSSRIINYGRFGVLKLVKISNRRTFLIFKNSNSLLKMRKFTSNLAQIQFKSLSIIC